MSRGATLSILGLYNNDPTVLDEMVLPDGFTNEEIQNVKDNILIECAEFEFLYSDPAMAKSIIGIWSAKELPYWQRVYDASQLEYNPIENYRRNESETVDDDRSEQHSGSDVNSRTGVDTMRASGSDTQTGNSNSTDTNSGTDTVTNKTSGYDSGTLVDHDSSETQHGHVLTNYANGTNTQQYGRVDTTEHNTQDSLQHGEKIVHDNKIERSMLAYGNIGVTTSQEMLTQELEIAKIINVIPVIIESFKNRFCIEVY